MAIQQPGSPIVLYPQKGRTIFGLSIAFAVLVTVFIALRFWSRSLLPKGARFGADDWTALAAWPFTVAILVIISLGFRRGFGLHVDQVPLVNIRLGLKFLFSGYMMYNTSMTLNRCSAVLFYRRVFRSTNTILKRLVWYTVALNVLWLITFYLVTILACNPVSDFWNITPPRHCLTEFPTQLGSVITSVFLDLWILILPLPYLWKLQIRPAKKAMLFVVFIAGYCVIIFSIGRVVAIGLAGDQLNKDGTWAFVTPLYWITCEISIATVSISLPSINHLIVRARSTGFSSLFQNASDLSSRRLRSRESSAVSYAPAAPLGKSLPERFVEDVQKAEIADV